MKLLITVVFFVCCSTYAFGQCAPQRVITLSSEPQLYGSQYKQTLPLREREVVLTFDDGPNKHTDRLLQILDQYCLKATFFVLGQNAKQYPDVLQRTVAAGHSIGTHTHSHQNLTRLHERRSQFEIMQGINEVESVIGKKVKRWFRFPYLAHSTRDEKFLFDNGISVFSIDIETRDWEKPGSLVLMDRVIKQLEQKKSGIIILHDIHQESVEFVPMLIRALRAKQYTFVHIQ